MLVDGRLQMAFRDPFAIAVLDGLAEELEAIPTGMLLIGQPSGSPESTVPRLAGLALDAVVFSLCGPGDHPAVEHLAARGIPMFSTGVPDDRRITQVRVDERGAAAEIARYLRGSRSPPGGDGHHADAAGQRGRARARGRGGGPQGECAVGRAAARLPRRLPARRGAADRRRLVGRGRHRGRPGPARRARGASGPRRSSPSPTSSPPASSSRAEELGLPVPGDLSVTGFDGVDLPWLPHRLTTMDQQGREKGRILGTLVRRTLAGGDRAASPSRSPCARARRPGRHRLSQLLSRTARPRGAARPRRTAYRDGAGVAETKGTPHVPGRALLPLLHSCPGGVRRGTTTRGADDECMPQDASGRNRASRISWGRRSSGSLPHGGFA